MSINAILFDIGNVITHFDFSAASEALAEQSDTEEDPIGLITDIRDALEEGQINSQEFVGEAIERIGYQGTEDEFIEIYQDIFTPNMPIWELVERLHGDHPIFIFSNTSDIHRDGLFRDFDIFSKFDDGIYSYEAKCTKPGEDIYLQAIEQLELDPAETGYIDDLAENVATGKRLGFQAHRYEVREHSTCLAWLKEHGVDLD